MAAHRQARMRKRASPEWAETALRVPSSASEIARGRRRRCAQLRLEHYRSSVPGPLRNSSNKHNQYNILRDTQKKKPSRGGLKRNTGLFNASEEPRGKTLLLVYRFVATSLRAEEFIPIACTRSSRDCTTTPADKARWS